MEASNDLKSTAHMAVLELAEDAQTFLNLLTPGSDSAKLTDVQLSDLYTAIAALQLHALSATECIDDYIDTLD